MLRNEVQNIKSGAIKSWVTKYELDLLAKNLWIELESRFLSTVLTILAM